MKAKPVLMENHPMRSIKIEKVLLSAGAVDKELAKSKRLIEFISGMKAQVVASQKRIPDFGVSPGMEVGTRVTVRGEKALELYEKYKKFNIKPDV